MEVVCIAENIHNQLYFFSKMLGYLHSQMNHQRNQSISGPFIHKNGLHYVLSYYYCRYERYSDQM